MSMHRYGRTSAHARGKHSPARKDFDHFVRGYIEAALFSSMDNEDEPLAKDYSRYDIADSSMKSIKRECAKFMKANKSLLVEYAIHRSYDRGQGTVMDYAGHDFWLTRNGHGAGFWDRDYGGHDEIGKQLTAASEKAGSSDMYVGDDGQIYVSPER